MRTVPGPPRKGLLLQNVAELRSDWIGNLRQYGEAHGAMFAVPTPWPMKPLLFMTDPAHVEETFITKAPCFQKPLMQRVLAPIIGGGVITAEGAAWRRKRRFIQPAFHESLVGAYADAVTGRAEEMVERWAGQGECDATDSAYAMALRVASAALLGREAGPEELAVAFEVDQALAEYLQSSVPLPIWFPTPMNIRMLRAARKLRSWCETLVIRRRRDRIHGSDLIGTLLAARDENGDELLVEEVREEVMSIVAAAYDTTALVMAWMLALVARHPDVARALRDEVDALAGGEPVGRQYRRLELARRVVMESLRLYPSVWLLARECIKDCEIGEFSVPRGSQIFAVPYLIHRHPAHFPDGDEFRPERWTDAFVKSLPKGAYVPFGIGQRMCVGSALSHCQLAIVLATAVRRLDFEAIAEMPAIHPGFVLNSREPIRLAVARRRGQSSRNQTS